jgi:hypothetical protein
MGIRVVEYGLTEERYVAFALIAFEICTVVLSIIKQSKYLDKMLLVSIVFIIVIFISPLNYEAVAIRSQKAIVDKYIANGVSFDNLDDVNKRKFAGAYQYIEDEDIANTLGLELTEKEKLSSYSTYISRYSSSYDDDTVDTPQIINESLEFNNINISKYDRIFKASYSDYENGILTIKYTLDESSYDYEKLEVNIDDWIYELLQADNTSSATLERVMNEKRIIEVNDEFDFCVSDINIKYLKDEERIVYARLSGYILEK